MDIKIKTEQENFKYRVCGILKHGDKYLGVKIADNEFFCLPGGHVEIGEDAELAALREMQEELGFPINILKLAGIAENFFKNKNGGMFHELSFYYIVEAKNPLDVNTEDYELVEIDKGKPTKLEFKWFTKEEIEDIDFRPAFVKDLIVSDDMLHIVSRDNESMKFDYYKKH